MTDRSPRSARALASFKPAMRQQQREAYASEVAFARSIRGRCTRQQDPIDVILPRLRHAFEVKSLLSNTNDKITVRRSAKLRKEAWAVKHGFTLHTVVIDNRFSRRPALYYKRGVGSYRIGSMKRVTKRELLAILKEDK